MSLRDLILSTTAPAPVAVETTPVSAALRLRLGLRPIKNRYMSIDFPSKLESAS